MPPSAQQRVYVSCGGPLPMSGTFLNFVPVSGKETRFESRSRHKHRSLCTRRQRVLRGQVRFQFITSVLPDRLKKKIWPALVGHHSWTNRAGRQGCESWTYSRLTTRHQNRFITLDSFVFCDRSGKGPRANLVWTTSQRPTGITTRRKFVLTGQFYLRQ